MHAKGYACKRVCRRGYAEWRICQAIGYANQTLYSQEDVQTGVNSQQGTLAGGNADKRVWGQEGVLARGYFGKQVCR